MQALHSLDVIEAIEVENSTRRRKVYKSRSDPFSLNDEDFRKRYRFKKSTATYIIDLVRDDLNLDRRGSGTSPEIQVLTAIRCWGRREVQEDAGDHHGLSQATTSRICTRVARALARHSASFIKMPSTFAEEERMMGEFYRIRSFPTVIGCIDCTHIKIRKCGGDAAQYYINRKGFYSLNVQVTCDAHLRIRDIVARWRGSTHDSRIFNESSLKERFETGSFRGRLLGDSGYKLEPYLFTPILRPRNRSEEKYNEAHIATRNTVERCFGVWKQRFQCLLFGMTCKLQNVKTTIVALAVLHNIAVDHGDVQLESGVEYNREVSREVPRSNASANAALQTFIRRHFSE
ncbi:putative nuclease HARBI1 [Melitaea cinxia]|uniref:putative nuclease HARBI1 n=1 Tax=Melitaea cinxia TaxID=113334 RepID=UPI001E270857|nr:putative nuclease HARBI1 [Melitaea cinxia]